MTIKEIARLAGVSVSTVSKIMNNKDESISTETRQRVLEIAKEYNYRPYASVLTQKTKTMIIGLLVRSAKSVESLLPGILESANAQGYFVTILQSSDDETEERKHLSAMISLAVDALIWEPVSPPSDDTLSELEASGIFLSLLTPETRETFRPNMESVGYRATGIMLNMSHRKIALISDGSLQSSQFTEGYRRALFEHNIPFQDDLIFDENDELPILKIFRNEITALLVFNYSKAASTYIALKEMHVTIPADLSLLSVLVPFAEQKMSVISSLEIPYRAYGRAVTNELISRIEKRPYNIDPVARIPLNHTKTLAVPYQSSQAHVLVVGSINMDHYLNFETLPSSGKTMSTSSESSYPGGKCLNETIGIVRLGHRAIPIAQIGSDESADAIYRLLLENSIDTGAVRRQDDVSTGQAYVFVQRDGNSMISIMAGANDFVTEEYISGMRSLFHNASFCLMQTEVPMEGIYTAAQLSKAYHVQTVLKPTACGPLDSALLKLIDFLIPNETELAAICPEQDSLKERVDHLLECGVPTVIVTLGENGCYYKSNAYHCEGFFPAEDFVSIDTSGAGDAFISAFVSYLLYGFDLPRAIRIAGFAAGYSTTKQGTTPSLVDRNTLEAYIRRVSPELM